MSFPYIKFEYEEFVSARKNILSAEIDALNFIKGMNSYKKLRKTELVKKSGLKASIRQAMKKINSLIREMPAVEVAERFIKHEPKAFKEKPTLREIKVIKKPEKKKRTIETELEEIRAKLERLRD